MGQVWDFVQDKFKVLLEQVQDRFRTSLGYIWGFVQKFGLGQVQGFVWDKFKVLFRTSLRRVQDRFGVVFGTSSGFCSGYVVLLLIMFNS